ncbi:MAG: hypothetical protein OXG65_09235 [Chloroflexi bacterium]|nr:hypothetical protein [Chloroflexota bacterium]
MSTATKRLKLPHPELTELVEAIRANVSGERTCTVDGTEIPYLVCDPWPDEADLAMYDEDGNIYLPQRCADENPERANLVALHEHVEITHKLAGRSHAYAHRRAILMELLAAKVMFEGTGTLHTYLTWRIGAYPDWKVPDRSSVVGELHDLLQADRPPRGRILEVVKAARL